MSNSRNQSVRRNPSTKASMQFSGLRSPVIPFEPRQEREMVSPTTVGPKAGRFCKTADDVQS
jgi:hypothetical protein